MTPEVNYLDDIPKWPRKCRLCLARNGMDAKSTLYCPPDINCPDYPFIPIQARARRAIARRLKAVVNYLDELVEEYTKSDHKDCH